MRKILIFLILSFTVVNAQDKPGESRFLLRGYAHSGLEIRNNQSAFVGGSFNPIFLWRQSNYLLFEAELEIEAEGSETNIGLEYANMAYIINDFAVLRLGQFLLPFGAFAEKLHPAWINRLPSKPLGFGHDGVGPKRGLGIELRGGLPLGSAKMSYSVYVINGPALNDGSDPNIEPEEAGKVLYQPLGEFTSENQAIGGRLGFLPISNSSMEIGLSAYYGKVGEKNSSYEDISSFAYALDFSFVKRISLLRGVIDIKAQFNGEKVDEAYYLNPEDSTLYTFNNKSTSYYTQLSYRPTNAGFEFINNLEFVGRYSALSFPQGALWSSEQTQYAMGINYWLDWRNVIKLAYEITNIEGQEISKKTKSDSVYLHWAFGF